MCDATLKSDIDGHVETWWFALTSESFSISKRDGLHTVARVQYGGSNFKKGQNLFSLCKMSVSIHNDKPEGQ